MLAFVLCVSALTPDPSSWVCSRECAGDCRMLHDGCPGCIKGLVALPQTCVPASAIAPVRCCGDGRRCVSICVKSTIPAKWTYSQAARECTARKLHVCTPNELASQRCFKTGCQLDRTQVWTSHECTRRECITNCTAAESLSVAGGVPWAPTYTFDNGVVWWDAPKSRSCRASTLATPARPCTSPMKRHGSPLSSLMHAAATFSSTWAYAAPGTLQIALAPVRLARPVCHADLRFPFPNVCARAAGCYRLLLLSRVATAP